MSVSSGETSRRSRVPGVFPPRRYTWSQTPDGSHTAARLTLTPGDCEAAGVQWTHCRAQGSGGGWLSFATLSSWKSASADRWRAAAAEGAGRGRQQHSGGRRCQKNLWVCWCRMTMTATMGRSRKHDLTPNSDSSEQSRQTWRHMFSARQFSAKMCCKQVVIWVTAAFSVA